MDIVIIAQYLRNIENFEGNNSRFVYLAKMLVGRGYRVEIITSDFYHNTKTHFKSVGKLEGIKVNALHEDGYPTNVCLKRFVSHYELAANVSKYLRTRKKPDVVYVAVPSLDVAKVAENYCKKNHVRFIVDIQDLWPEAFKLKFDIPVVSDLVFAPLNAEANAVYGAADQIVAVSQTYASRGMKANKKCKKPLVVYLGTEFDTFDLYRVQNRVEKPADELWIGYVGTLGASYDITVASHALHLLQADQEWKDELQSNGYSTVVFQVMGDGPDRLKFETEAKKQGIKANFTGSLPYPQMVGRLCACDLAVNPINHGAAQSIINKVGDYAASGLYVINTLENEEYRKLVHDYQCGFNCKANDPKSVAKAIRKWLKYSIEDRKKIGQNSRKLGEERFDRKRTYQEIVDIIERQ